MSQPPIDLAPQDWLELTRILSEQVPQLEVWAFGSRAKGCAKPYSDLDLALITPAPLTLRQMADLQEAFSQSDLPIKVDLLDWASAAPSFRQLIERDKVVVQRGGASA
jgi:predicted nucleotidyltransferase